MQGERTRFKHKKYKRHEYFKQTQNKKVLYARKIHIKTTLTLITNRILTMQE